MNKKNNTLRGCIRLYPRGVSTVQIAVALLVGVILILGGLGSFRYVTQSGMNGDLGNISDLVSLTRQYAQMRGASAFSAVNITTANLAGLNFFPSTSGTGADTVANMSSGKSVIVGPINVIRAAQRTQTACDT